MHFASIKEVKRWQVLCLMKTQNIIDKLQRQVRFPIVVNEQKICIYIADFVYEENGKRVVEDCKGFKTQEYKLKKKLMKACLGIDILET